MRQKQFGKKLRLNKTTIADLTFRPLQVPEMKEIYAAGTTGPACACLDPTGGGSSLHVSCACATEVSCFC